MKQREFIQQFCAAIKENKERFDWSDSDIVENILKIQNYYEKDQTLENLLSNLI